LFDIQFPSEQIDILDKEELGFDHADVGVNIFKIQLGNSGEQPVSSKLEEKT
jgi:hypothetical protein